MLLTWGMWETLTGVGAGEAPEQAARIAVAAMAWWRTDGPGGRRIQDSVIQVQLIVTQLSASTFPPVGTRDRAQAGLQS